MEGKASRQKAEAKGRRMKAEGRRRNGQGEAQWERLKSVE
jgi:hypothetical protein